MNKIITLISLLATIGSSVSLAQTIGGGVTISGTTNALLQVNGAYQTNTLYVTIPSKTVVLSGISNTNEVAIFSYGLCQSGFTNLNLIGSVTNTFPLSAGGTNGGALTFTVPQQTIAVQFSTWAQANIGGTNNNSIYVP